MNIKMIVCDMDGTLLNSQFEIASYTSQIIKKVIEQDIIFVVASGRSHYMMDNYYRDLGMHNAKKAYMIGLNGVELYSFQEKKMDRKNTFSMQDGIDMGHILLSQHLVPILMYADKTIIVSDLDEKEACLLKDTLETTYKGAFASIQIKKLVDLPNEYFDKVCILSSLNNIDSQISSLENDLGENIDVYHVGDEWIELMKKGINKADRLMEIMKKENIMSDELLIFGDSQNDVGMFALSQYSFAMENARREIKGHAKYIAQSNDELGVAKKIVQMLDLS